MRRHSFALAVLILLLLGAVYGQKYQRPLTAEGLKTAATPRRYEPPSPTATPKELESHGDEYRANKAYADAIDYYRTALSKSPEKPAQGVLYNKIGIAELQMQHYKEAQKNFERALKCQHDYAEAYNNLGAAFYLQKKYGKSVDQYKKAIRLHDEDASFHNNLGTAYFMRKEFPQAVTEYQRAIAIDPEVFERTSQSGISAQLSSPENRAQFNYLLAKMYAQAGNFDRSILYLRKAMEDGYKDIRNVYKDQEFAGLRKDPRFDELMKDKPVGIPE